MTKLKAGFAIVLAFVALSTGAVSVSEPVAVTPCSGYNSWPMIQALGGKLVCAYSRGSAHSIGEGCRGVFAKISCDGGKTWSKETCVVNDPEIGEVTIGKGLDGKGGMLLWIRNWGKIRRHDLDRTTDGVSFERIASPTLDPMPIQITDVFSVPGVGLMSFWFAGDYRKGSGNSWGTLTSADNGRTWTQRTVEGGLSKMEWPTEQSAAYLGNGRILAVARTERGGHCQFQLTSTDYGKTWTRRNTNITDVLESTPSLIFSPETGLVSNYYYQRGAGVLKRRTAEVARVWGHPEAWPEPEIVCHASANAHHAGNVNACVFGSSHVCTFYSGDEHQTSVMLARV